MTTITIPTDVETFIWNARRDYQGTDAPDALKLGQRIAEILKAEKFTPREIRLFAARYVMALESYDDEANDNVFYMHGTLAEIDFKKYWNEESSII